MNSREKDGDMSFFFLSDFFTPTRFGAMKGHCMLCGRETNKGLEADFSAKFTSWNLFKAGECLCPNCYELSRNQAYRRSMWIACKEGITFFKKDQMLQHLLDPPDPPFAMYLTKTWKKQGFLKLINKVNYSKNSFFIALDSEIIHVVMNNFTEMLKLAKGLREKGISKKELRSGKFHVYRYEDLDLEVIEKIKRITKNPQWRLVIYAIE